MNTPPIVSAPEWQAARHQLLVKEKEVLRDRDQVFRTYFINSRGDGTLGNTWSWT
jgi:predicted dithiol-disulfide oxidoreductase (DUF899 family)